MSSTEERERTRSTKLIIAALESELHQAIELLAEVTRRIQDLTKAIEGYRSLIAPIRTLPIELLSEVFVSASYIEDLAPVKISAVCHRWRNVVLATPQAWSRIWLDNDLPREKSYVYVSTFLKRSDPIPLHVALPEEFDPHYYPPGFSLHSTLFDNLHRILCMTVSCWQLAHFNSSVFPNTTQMSLARSAQYFEPENVNISRFPRLESIDSLFILWLNLSTPARDWFPPLQRLSISVDPKSAWVEIIQCCSSTLKALIVWGRPHYETSQIFSADLPALKSLEILDFPHNTPWSNRVTTPVLLSYKETWLHPESTPLQGAAIGSHTDVGTVTHLFTEIVPILSRYPALQVLGLQIPSDSAFLVCEQFIQDAELCPLLRHIEFIPLDSLPPVDRSAIELAILEKMKETRKYITVTFRSEQVFIMPFDMANTLCGNYRACYPETSTRHIALLYKPFGKPSARSILGGGWMAEFKFESCELRRIFGQISTNVRDTISQSFLHTKLTIDESSQPQCLPESNSHPQELRMLRSIQRSKKKLADSLQAQIFDAELVYEGAMERYRAQQLVLESLLSEIHTAKQFIDMLNKQKRIIDDDMSELRGLVHPIRQCPPEVLCHIFTMTLTPIKPGDRIHQHLRQLQQTYRVMSVCRYWRDVALGCPILWSAVPVPLNRKSSDVQSFWNRAVERIKNAVASICITHVGTEPEPNKLNSRHQICQAKLDICDLRQFSVISKLRIETLPKTEAALALSLMTRFPIGKMDRLEFDGFSETAMQPPEWWSFTRFLKKFPPFASLAVQDVSIPTPPDAFQFHSVTTLLIGGDSAVSLADLLPSFPNLEYLGVSSLCGLDGHEMTSEYEMVQLRYLSVEEKWSFPWDAPINAPNLTSLCLLLNQTDITSECESFLASCIALTSVELRMAGNSLMSLSSAVGWLLHLTLDIYEDMLGPFIHWEETEVDPPFPKLKTLTLVYPIADRDYNVPAFWYFDDIVRKRCLPRSNTASQLIAPLVPLETLTIRQDPELQPTWKESVYYATATTRVIEEESKYFSMTLSWILSSEVVE